jgi:hypothetical protein
MLRSFWSRVYSFTRPRGTGANARISQRGQPVSTQHGGMHHLLAVDDLRELPLSMRKANLERLLARRPEGIFVNPFERGGASMTMVKLAVRGR